MQTASNIIWKMFHRIKYLLWTSALLLSCMAEQERGYHVIDMPVKKKLAVVSELTGSLVVVTQFENVSNFDILVLKDPPSLFVTSDRMDIDDIGPSEKRKPYTLADYERLAPKQLTKRRQDITATFAWLQGTHTYEVSISGNYEDPVDHRTWKGQRIATQFTWTKKR